MIQLYTDGSSMSNTGLGGIAYMIIYEDGSTQLGAKHIGKADSNKAELIAIIEGLKMLAKKSDIELYTDSLYCINLIKSKNITKNYKHKKLINELKDLINNMNSIKSHHVKAHSANPSNDEVDKFAKIAARDKSCTISKLCLTELGKYSYSRTELEDFTKDYLKSLSNEQFASILSQIYCAKFIYNKVNFSGSVNLIK